MLNQINVNDTAAVANETAHVNSPKYKQVSTKLVIDKLISAGWIPVRVAGKRGNSPYSKHLVEFRNPLFCNDSDYEPRVLLTNSHDGTSSFQLRLGVFRLVCSNGLVVGTSTFKTHRIRHVGFCLSKVDAALAEIEAATTTIRDLVTAFNGRTLTAEECSRFVFAAAELRWGNKVPLQYGLLLKPRRPEDVGLTLWQVFNVVQENLIKGGIQYASVDVNSRQRRNTTRGIKAIDSNIKLNEALFALAQSFLTSETK